MTALTPSRIARTIAAQEWPDVQAQSKIAPGTFDFSCSGHGGIVAVLDAADFDDGAVAIAREHGRTELLVYGFGQSMTTERYQRASLEEYAARHNFPVHECWVGEEDCDWALLVIANPTLAEGMARNTNGRQSAGEILTYARENAGRWNADILAELDART